MSEPTEPRKSPEPEERASGPGGLARLLGAVPRFLGSRFVLLLLAAAAAGVLVYLALSAQSFLKHEELEREKARLEAEIEELQDENRLLTLKVQRLQSDPAYAEDEARKKLGLVRPGETVYRLSEEPDLSEEQVPPPPPARK